MKISVALATVINQIFFSTALATVLDLVARQTCESASCPNPGWLLAPIVGAGATLWDDLQNTFQNEPTTNLSPVPLPGKIDNSRSESPSSTPDPEEIFVTGESNECDAVAPSAADLPGNGEVTNFIPCQVTQVVIFPQACDDITQNTMTATKLVAMDGSYLTSIDPMCSVEGGVFFWLAHLRPDQIEELRQWTGAVSAIVPNAQLKSTRSINLDPSQPRALARQRKSRRLKKRVRVEKIRRNAEPNLRFLSTPPGQTENGLYYAYLSAPPESIVRVYMLGPGADPSSGDLSLLKLGWLYAIDSKKEANEDPDFEGTGTCHLSLIAGPYNGVSNKADVTMAKTGLGIASYMDGIGKVIVDIKLNPSKSKGWTVLNIPSGFDALPEHNVFVLKLHYLLTILARTYQVIIVTTAGGEPVMPETRRPDHPAIPIAQWPGLFARDNDIDIITVGPIWSTGDKIPGLERMVNGARMQWSPGTPNFMPTVHAPSNGNCIYPSNTARTDMGPGHASAIVSGLVAYFLSVPGIGDWIRRQDNTPRAMVEYLKKISYARPSADVDSVWNGLNWSA